jgi:ABC-type antimicrobial peptide transport system permease subunit
MALGAQPQAITAMFVHLGLRMTGVGIVCGLVAAFAVVRLMSSLLFNVSPVDPVTYLAVTAGVIATAYVACYLPSRRAATVDPIDALRTE